MRHVVFFAGFLAAAAMTEPQMAKAELLRYKDAQGNVNYVDSVEKVPHEFRGQLQSSPALPPISRAGKATYEDASSESEKLSSEQSTSKKDDQEPSARLGRQKLEIYVTSWCQYCKALESFLTKHRIRYTRYDIETDSKARKKHEALGGGGVPVAKLGTRVIRGFDQKAFEKLL